MNDTNTDAPALVRRRRRIARQQREKTPEPIAKIGGVRPKYSDEESSSTTTTTNEYKNRNSTLGSNRLKPKTASTSSGGGSSTYANVAYREKILNRRDRAHKPSRELVRSHSTPRQLKPDAVSDGEQKQHSNHDASKHVIKFLHKAKRSLSIPRYDCLI